MQLGKYLAIGALSLALAASAGCGGRPATPHKFEIYAPKAAKTLPLGIFTTVYPIRGNVNCAGAYANAGGSIEAYAGMLEAAAENVAARNKTVRNVTLRFDINKPEIVEYESHLFAPLPAESVQDALGELGAVCRFRGTS